MINNVNNYRDQTMSWFLGTYIYWEVRVVIWQPQSGLENINVSENMNDRY